VQPAVDHLATEDQVDAEEPGHEPVPRGPPQPVRRVGLHQPAGPHDRDPVRERQRLVLVVGDVQHGAPGGREHLGQLVEELVAQGPVERSERLVEHQQPGAWRERAGQRDPLLLPAGQLGDPPVLEPAQRDQPEHLVDPGAHLVATHAAHPRPERHVVGDRAVREQRVVLEHQPDVALVGAAAGEVPVVEVDRPAGERFEPGDRPQQRGLPAAGRAEDAHHLTVGGVQVEPVDGVERAVPDRDVAAVEHQNRPT
jgi:hypothetical protein